MAAAKIPRITVDSRGRITSISEQDAFANLDPHALLGAEHSDVTAANPTRGDIIVASSIPKWARFAIGGSGKYLRSDGTDPAWSDLLIGDLPEGGTWDLNSTDLTLTNGHLKLGTAAKGFYERARTTAMGEWTDIAFSAGNFTASGSMTWTVEGADQIALAYMLLGKTMFLTFAVQLTTVGGTPSNFLQITMPFASAKAVRGPCQVVDNSAGKAGVWIGSASSTTLLIAPAAGGNWSLSTNATSVYGTVILETT